MERQGFAIQRIALRGWNADLVDADDLRERDAEHLRLGAAEEHLHGRLEALAEERDSRAAVDRAARRGDGLNLRREDRSLVRELRAGDHAGLVRRPCFIDERDGGVLGLRHAEVDRRRQDGDRRVDGGDDERLLRVVVAEVEEDADGRAEVLPGDRQRLAALRTPRVRRDSRDDGSGVGRLRNRRRDGERHGGRLRNVRDRSGDRGDAGGRRGERRGGHAVRRGLDRRDGVRVGERPETGRELDGGPVGDRLAALRDRGRDDRGRVDQRRPVGHAECDGGRRRRRSARAGRVRARRRW